MYVFLQMYSLINYCNSYDHDTLNKTFMPTSVKTVISFVIVYNLIITCQ